MTGYFMASGNSSVMTPRANRPMGVEKMAGSSSMPASPYWASTASWS